MSDTQRTTVTRRSALKTGGLAALAAGLLSAGSPQTALAAVLPPADAPLIDQAEALLVTISEILPQLSSRDVSNIAHGLELLADACVVGPGSFAARLAERPLSIGPGNRVHDRIDADEAAARRAAVTHAAAVAQYADEYMVSGVEAGLATCEAAIKVYGEELGSAIGQAAFALYLKRKYGIGA